jgi:hypothetical protein
MVWKETAGGMFVNGEGKPTAEKLKRSPSQSVWHVSFASLECFNEITGLPSPEKLEVYGSDFSVFAESVAVYGVNAEQARITWNGSIEELEQSCKRETRRKCEEIFERNETRVPVAIVGTIGALIVGIGTPLVCSSWSDNAPFSARKMENIERLRGRGLGLTVMLSVGAVAAGGLALAGYKESNAVQKRATAFQNNLRAIYDSSNREK